MDSLSLQPNQTWLLIGVAYKRYSDVTTQTFEIETSVRLKPAELLYNTVGSRQANIMEKERN